MTVEALRRCAAASRDVAAVATGVLADCYSVEAAGFEAQAREIDGARRAYLERCASLRRERDDAQRQGEMHADRERRRRREAVLLEHEGRLQEARDEALAEAAEHRSEASIRRFAARRAEQELQEVRRRG